MKQVFRATFDNSCLPCWWNTWHFHIHSWIVSLVHQAKYTCYSRSALGFWPTNTHSHPDLHRFHSSPGPPVCYALGDPKTARTLPCWIRLSHGALDTPAWMPSRGARSRTRGQLCGRPGNVFPRASLDARQRLLSKNRGAEMLWGASSSDVQHQVEQKIRLRKESNKKPLDEMKANYSIMTLHERDS